MKNIKDLIETIQDVPSWKDVVSELKEVDTLLTEISKTNNKLSKSALESIANNAFRAAGQYGGSAADYLSGFKEASLAGYENAEGIAELSMAARNAGDMTAELADQILSAANEAYSLNGSVSELAKVLDGMNYISGQNALSMAELAKGMAALGSTAASLGIGADETAAALGTMIAVTRQSGSEAARALKEILLNIRQVADGEEGMSARGIARYEAACSALNVKLKETKYGVLSLRDPMEILKDLAAAYNSLNESDPRRSGLINAVGSSSSGEQLDALLSQWDTYEAMVRQYADGTGSMAAEAELTVDSWEGSLNRLSNTWTSTVGNFANSDAIVSAVNHLNNLLTVINNVTENLGSFGTIGLSGLGIGITAFVKNFA
jgi:phage tail tape measure protein, TP901 family, core region